MNTDETEVVTTQEGELLAAPTEEMVPTEAETKGESAPEGEDPQA